MIFDDVYTTCSKIVLKKIKHFIQQGCPELIKSDK